MNSLKPSKTARAMYCTYPAQFLKRQYDMEKQLWGSH